MTQKEFLRKLGKVKTRYRWYLDTGLRIRGRVRYSLAYCPLGAVIGNREGRLGYGFDKIGLTTRQATAIMDAADKDYDTPLRRALLNTLNLNC